MFLCVVSAYAQSFEKDGLSYNVIKQQDAESPGEVEVRQSLSEGDGQCGGYAGDIVIPAEVVYDDQTYEVTKIRDWAFRLCPDITSVTIPNSVTYIGDAAFFGCTGLTSVTIPNSVITIEGPAFGGCSNLTSVIFGQKLTTIGTEAFISCSSLSSITIPNSVEAIGDRAFDSCSLLTSVILGNQLTTIGKETFQNCPSLSSITIPNSVTSIGKSAFSGCSSLTSITIPNSVTSIGYQVFLGCTSLTSITIPKSVTKIRSQAFAKCSKLEEVYCLAEKVPSTETDAFQDSYPNYATLYVPASAINDYKTTAPWSEFGTIKTIEGGETKKCATPTISYGNKVLTFSCETEGVEYVYEIKDTDIKKGYDEEVNLSATYEISVYATESGYENSNVATATLVWTRGTFTETTPDDPTSVQAVKESVPVLISTNNGAITVKGELDGQAVAVYSADGKLLGSDSISCGQATIST